ncbi:MAG: type II toxin-antitoxin system prevent-host-death family antitoxin [bacterium]|nr:type II toxin-antitoxin system prevent-host-death family antitoxin [bacterium]
MESQKIPAGEFRVHCLKLIDEVRQARKEIIITKRGKPVAKLVPIGDDEVPEIFGRMKGTVTILGDIVGPTGDEWEANS